MHQTGYSYSLWPNLILVFILFGIILCILAIFIALDVTNYFKGRQDARSQQRKEPWMTNFLVRFLYELFFEICLCLMINASYLDTDSKAQVNSFIVCILLALISVAAIVAITLLFCSKTGPKKRDTYARNSFLGSFWGIRLLSRDKADQILEEKPVKFALKDEYEEPRTEVR